MKCDGCDLPASVCGMCPDGVKMEPLHPYGRYGFIYKNGGQLYQVTQPPDSKRFAGCLSCDSSKPRMCGWTMRRPHAGCVASLFGTLGCRLRNILKGKVPKRVPVKAFVCYIRDGRPVWKQKLSSLFFTIAELFVT